MKRLLATTGRVVILVFALIGVISLSMKGCVATIERQYANAVPPAGMQTFRDFVNWQSEVRSCNEVQVRGVTYYHVSGPKARPLASGRAFYVFDAKGNYVGWSKDGGDVLRNQAIFYPQTFLPHESTMTEISYATLKEGLLGKERHNEVEPQHEMADE